MRATPRRVVGSRYIRKQRQQRFSAFFCDPRLRSAARSTDSLVRTEIDFQIGRVAARFADETDQALQESSRPAGPVPP